MYFYAHNEHDEPGLPFLSIVLFVVNNVEVKLAYFGSEDPRHCSVR